MNMKFKLFFLTLLSVYSCTLVATEFNSRFIKSKDKIDLKKFVESGFVEDGRYLLGIYFNGEYLYSENINVNEGKACITNEVLQSLPINDKGLDVYSKNTHIVNDKLCYLVSNEENTSSSIDIGKGNYKIIVPQIYVLTDYQAGFVNKKYWDDGIPALFVDYNVNYFSSKANEYSDWNSSSSVYGVIGANYNALRIRANFQSSDDNPEFSSLYGFMPIRSLDSKLTFGNTSFGSDIYDGFRMNGVRLQSDDNMLPSNLRGYSPVVSGNADTNAVITIRQQGSVLKIVNVNAGPYVIDDISQSSQGVLDVEVKQADGVIKHFQVNGADTLFLTRPGHIRYSVSAGIPDSSYYDHSPGFISAEASYGLNNNLSLFTGTLLSEEYQSYTLGAGVNFNYFGAVSANISNAAATLFDNSDVEGLSYGIAYNNTIPDIDLDMRVAGYRFSEEQYYEFDEYLSTYQNDSISDSFETNNNRKSESSLILSKSFADVSTNFSYTLNEYWDDRRKTVRYNLNASKPFVIYDSTLYLSINAYKTDESYIEYESSEKFGEFSPTLSEEGISLSITMPLGGGNNSIAFQTRSVNNRYTQSLTYSGNTDKGDYYSVAYDEYEGESIGITGNYNRNFAVVSTQLGASYKTNSYSQVNANVSGTVLASEHGIAYSGITAGDTKLLIDTKAPNVTVTGNGHDESNAFGLALINGLTPYRKTNNTVDYKSLPKNVEVLDNIKSVALTEGAVGFQQIRARQGDNFIARIESQNAIPFGAVIIDKENMQKIGMVSSGQKSYISGVNIDSQLKAVWGDQECQLVISAAVINSKKTIRPVVCK
ncbi:fimbria/pilus outer membrane usher protein [Shewanella sp. VB17]|uniref:fimbria/pilus outer membrane usher protein n=1 Tax=Shewanella sp. VB17 TaxID=2739432 RepID=UPI001C2726D5|nr:fimbria/pilus outer membrane usher protein [Shewanella sp. VB17]